MAWHARPSPSLGAHGHKSHRAILNRMAYNKHTRSILAPIDTNAASFHMHVFSFVFWV